MEDSPPLSLLVKVSGDRQNDGLIRLQTKGFLAGFRVAGIFEAGGNGVGD